VPHVIMGLGANMPDPQRQTRLRALERLVRGPFPSARGVRRTGRRPWKSVSAVNSGALAYLKDIPVTRRLPSESTGTHFSFPYQSAAPCSIPVDCVA
jgi:hypothetical protein